MGALAILAALLAFVLIAKWSDRLPSSLAGMPFAASARPEPEIIVKGSDAIPHEDVVRAVNIFRSNCLPLGERRLWSDLTSVTAVVRSEIVPHRLTKGWQVSISLALTVPDDPKVIPAVDKRIGVMAGHTLWYDLGGGHSPGYFASKRVSQLLCGAPVVRGVDTFVSVPALSILP